jgi:hypothetical protein
MKKQTLFFTFLFIVTLSKSQTIIDRDPELSNMIDEISAERIEQHVRKLVSFHTRHNLSSKNDPKQGIGAAWNWIKS